MFLTSPTLASLRFFEAAARLMSFKRAAVELHVTQGAVSQQIKHLEQVLGGKLFYRMPRQITLTEEGQRFAAVVAQALEAIEQGAKAVAAARSGTEIRLRAGPSFALRWLVPRLGEFHARHADIKLFIEGVFGHFDPARRDFDIAIELVREAPPSLRSEPLMDEYLIPVCSPDYLATQGFLKQPMALARCTLLHDARAWEGCDADAEWRYWLCEVGAVDVDSSKGRFFSLANMSIEAALTHQGVAMGRAALIKDFVDAGLLVAPFKNVVMSPAKYCLVYPEELGDRPGIQSVIRWLHEQAEKSGQRLGSSAAPDLARGPRSKAAPARPSGIYSPPNDITWPIAVLGDHQEGTTFPAWPDGAASKAS
jgi:LysR family glycine cleavage system transcriptional activator